MQLGMIGLGRMGANLVRRLLRGGHQCVVFDIDSERVQELVIEGATGATTLDDFVHRLDRPRAAWVMVPAGQSTEQIIAALSQRMDADDIIIDGGNSYYKDDVCRAKALEQRQIHYVDVGTSGGIRGLERGYCLMIGGAACAVTRLEPIFTTLAPGRGDLPRTPSPKTSGDTTAEEGYLYCGPAGAGHFVKMVHNGIEYGLMQAYAEGFDILRHAVSQDLSEEYRYDFDIAGVAEVWRRGSVISSWLLDLTAMALAEDPTLSRYTGFIQDSGEGRWTVKAAVEEAVPADVLSAALYARFRSRQVHTFAEKLLSAMRSQFGGHTEPASGG